MSANLHEASAAALHDLIVGSSSANGWQKAFGPGGIPQRWQHDVVARILTLAYEQDVEYISASTPEGADWDIVAFTQLLVIRVQVIYDAESVAHVESVAFPRSSLETLDLIAVGEIPSQDERWPSDVQLIGHYGHATLPLPLDKFASSDNRRALSFLLTSLLEDLAR